MNNETYNQKARSNWEQKSNRFPSCGPGSIGGLNPHGCPIHGGERHPLLTSSAFDPGLLFLFILGCP